MKEVVSRLNEKLNETLKQVTHNLAERSLDNGSISVERMDENQLVHYNLAYHTAESNIANFMGDYAWNQAGPIEQEMAVIFAGEALNRLRGELAGRQNEYGVTDSALNALFDGETNKLVQEAQKAERYNTLAEEALAGNYGQSGLSEDQLTLRDTFRQFADEVVAPKAEHVHRHDDFIPDEILNGLAEMGAFGITIPGQYGGFLDDYGNVGMMLVTEELSRGGLSIAGSLITRPEILSKALIKGGTDEQKQKWLPALAAGQCFNSIAVTEPNYGSDVAGMKVAADKTEGG